MRLTHSSRRFIIKSTSHIDVHAPASDTAKDVHRCLRFELLTKVWIAFASTYRKYKIDLVPLENMYENPFIYGTTKPSQHLVCGWV